MGQARAWTGWGCSLLGVVGAFVVLGAQEPTKLSPGARQKGAFGQPTDRTQWQMPARVMDEVGVKPGMTVADVGAGDGWFTFYLADRVGPSGRVIAEDIDAKALEAVRERCAREKVSNVSVVVGGMEDPTLPAGAVDVALMVNVLSALGDARTFLGNLAKGLKPHGRLVIIDWDPMKLYPEMPEQETKSALREALRQLQDADFEVVKTLDFLPAQTMWICQPRVPQRSVEASSGARKRRARCLRRQEAHHVSTTRCDAARAAPVAIVGHDGGRDRAGRRDGVGADCRAGAIAAASLGPKVRRPRAGAAVESPC